MAPGRINLIGEHVDYNDGFVLPGAIDRHLIFAIAVGGTERCNIQSHDFKEGVSFSINELNPGETWVNYLMGVLDAFQRRGLAIGGVDCIFGGDIPAGAGMASSAAVCAGFAFAINELFETNLPRLELAMIAQHSEHHYAGVMCGIMDQYASLFGAKDSALLLDCRKLTHETIPFQFPSHRLLLVDTKLKHSLASSAYNNRRSSCEEGVRILQKKNPSVCSLRDVTSVMLDAEKNELGSEIARRCRFVVEEIARAQQGAEFLKQGNLVGFGNMMYESHKGLSEEYEVSCAELDLLVTLAARNKSCVVGSRMMGGGFGGCTINIVLKENESNFRQLVQNEYFAAFRNEPDFYEVSLSQGAHQVVP